MQVDLPQESGKANPNYESINIMMWQFRELNRRLANVTLSRCNYSWRLLSAQIRIRSIIRFAWQVSRDRSHRSLIFRSRKFELFIRRDCFMILEKLKSLTPF